MSKKTFTIFIILLLVAIGLIAWFFFRTGPATPSDTGTSTGSDLFPFGQGPVGTGTGQGGTGGQSGTSTVIDITSSGKPLPQLRQLWKEPVAGSGFLTSSTTTIAVRFVDRAKGHIYESPVDAIGERQLSNVTIPQIYEALVADNTGEMIMRYLKDDNVIQSFYARLATSTVVATTSIEGYFLPQNIRDIELLGTNILYFDPSLSTGNLMQSDIDGTKRVSLMNTDLRDWSMSWNASSTIFLSTRPSGLVEGHGYLFDIPKGTITKIVNSIGGLTGNMSPLGKYIFLSAQNGDFIASASYDIKGQETATLSIATLSDKCAWSNTHDNIIYCAVPVNVPQGVYPDDWYQGSVSFSDNLWKVNMATGAKEIVLSPSFDALQEMDMETLSVDPTDSYLTFRNKNDMSLWLYRF